MVIILLLFIIFFIIVMSLKTLFIPMAIQEKFLSWQSFIYLIFVYTTIFLGFGLIYFILIQQGFPILIEDGTIIETDFFYSLQTSFYFSGLTLFSVGYGDVTPVGIGQILAVIEAMIGYTVQASFVVRTVVDFRRERG
ncbi:ion channel [Caldibacillus thermolactis]|jgi:potassium channel LctB|uniref:Ion channel n=1 Tax=Pallidibacillus thermolactis TaxID=251051 RepID=A0ABT2WID3_9BACI|nr:ion channel [Pallidibacillus thermolactis]MCU9595450.1 ion channel [Pallidibacillus thermolactis]MCU9601177.1 ion channel [Pallidibacillus thermolactis subsp. kokeshiiformis]MED1673453.1 ion channel [Pallidibacillus thermolactis subsp. kokeshiiformis]